MKESVIQTQIVEYLSAISRSHGFLFFSVPNEGMMTAALMGSLPKSAMFAMLTKFKKMGMQPGASDLVIGWRGRMYAVEVKSETGAQSENQRLFESWCKSCEVPYRLVRSVRDVSEALIEWGIV